MTFPSLPRLLIAALLLTLAGCATTAVGPVRAGSYTLSPKQQARPARNALLVYESFSDSRCPQDARCVWAGELTFQFRLAGPRKTEAFTLSPAKPAFVSTVLDGAQIALDPASIPPAPRTGEELFKPYPITLTITRPAP